MSHERRVACIGCGGLVPDIDGPSHRYMLASPGCWAAYTGLLAGPAETPLPSPRSALIVDTYAVQHPGVPDPQATQSVWVHLIALYLVLERGWPPSQLVRIRRLGADASERLAWLDPPASMGHVTAIDVAQSGPRNAAEAVGSWVDGAWNAWGIHHAAVRQVADALVDSLG